jgi:hypothetical protein
MDNALDARVQPPFEFIDSDFRRRPHEVEIGADIPLPGDRLRGVVQQPSDDFLGDSRGSTVEAAESVNQRGNTATYVSSAYPASGTECRFSVGIQT